MVKHGCCGFCEEEEKCWCSTNTCDHTGKPAPKPWYVKDIEDDWCHCVDDGNTCAACAIADHLYEVFSRMPFEEEKEE